MSEPEDEKAAAAGRLRASLTDRERVIELLKVAFEVVHAIAPRAALTIVLVKGTSLDSPGQAVTASVAALRLGASQGGIISLSPAGQIGGEHCVDNSQLTQLNAALQADTTHHVTVVAATGDTGAAGEPCALIDAIGGSLTGFTPRKEVNLVVSDPLVLAAGGTTFNASHTTGAWTGETAWGLPDGSPGSAFQASGGGFSHLFRRPSYQNGVPDIGSMRGIPDVAADGDPVTGIAVITSNSGGGYTLSGHAGTSASAPLWRDELEREMPGTPERPPGLFTVDLNGAMIGQVILKRATGHGAGKAELGYMFLPQAWGFGYAAEACAVALGWLDDTLPGEPVVLKTQTANARSMRLAARLGFTEVERFEAWGAEQWFGMRFPVTPPG